MRLLFAIACALAACADAGCGGAQRCPPGDAAIPTISAATKRIEVRCSSDPPSRVRMGIYADKLIETWVECPPGQVLAPDPASIVEKACPGHAKACVRARLTCAPRTPTPRSGPEPAAPAEAPEPDT